MLEMTPLSGLISMRAVLAYDSGRMNVTTVAVMAMSRKTEMMTVLRMRMMRQIEKMQAGFRRRLVFYWFHISKTMGDRVMTLLPFKSFKLFCLTLQPCSKA